jgi:hypothetical protein
VEVSEMSATKCSGGCKALVVVDVFEGRVEICLDCEEVRLPAGVCVEDMKLESLRAIVRELKA